jgi:CHAT domain-containing protein
MFMIHLLTHYNRKYLRTGDVDREYLNITSVLPPSVDVLLGSVPEELEQHCNALGILDPTRAEDQTEIGKHLTALNDVELSTAEPLVLASVLALRIKFNFFRMLHKMSSETEDKTVVSLITEQTAVCWEAFREIFRVSCLFPHPNVDFFPKYVSRFVHFYQAYQLFAKRTKRNVRHAHEMAALLSAALLKYISCLPPEMVGRCYTAPKMIRELLLTMKMSFPNNKRLNTSVLRILAMSYDYLNCVSLLESKQKHVALLFSGRRQALDDLIEQRNSAPSLLEQIDIPEQIRDLTIESTTAELLTDLSRSAMINDFGSQSETPAYCEEGVLHLKLLVANETLDGHLLTIVNKGRAVTKHVACARSRLVDLVTSVQEKTSKGNVEALSLFGELVHLLGLADIGDDIARLIGQNPVQRVYVYPDGYLWNLPWPHLISLAWKHIEAQLSQRGLKQPAVAVKLGARHVETDMRAVALWFLAGWHYEQKYTASSLIPRRGMRTEGLFPNLPGARDEVRRLYSLWRNEGFNCSMNEDVTAPALLNVVNGLEQSCILHVACHGDSGVTGIPALWFPGTERDEYTALHYERILRTIWNRCEFVFFNACFGAAGEPFVGGPVMGLQEALSVAGTRRIVAPLWPVSDDLAVEMALSFHRSLVNCRDYLDAFTNAHRTLTSTTDPAKLLTSTAYVFFLL